MRLIELKRIIEEAKNLLTGYSYTTFQNSPIITNTQPIKQALLLLIRSGLLNSDSEEVQRVISSEGERMLFDNSCLTIVKIEIEFILLYWISTGL